MYNHQLGLRSQELKVIQSARAAQNKPSVQPHPLAITRPFLHRIILDTLRLHVERSLQPGPEFDGAVEACVGSEVLSESNIMETVIMLARSANAVDCEFEGMKNEEWSTNGLWNLP